MLVPNRHGSSTAYRYGFNGKEKDDELKGEGNSYDYGERMYDLRIGKFFSIDPLASKFPYWSPYHFAGNTPIQAIDLDGREILFVNGHYQDNWFGRNLLGSSKSGKEYWGAGFQEAAQKFFSDKAPITDANYINGSSTIGFDQDGSDRYIRGYNYAKDNLDKITAGYVKEKAEFKIIGHSEGCAYGAGVADGLMEAGWSVSKIVYLSADETSDFSTPYGPKSYQLGYDGDWVVGNKRISGVTKSGVLNSDNLAWDEVHGETKSASVFKNLYDLITTETNGIRDSFNKKTKYAEVKESPRYNSKFTEIDFKIIIEKDEEDEK